MDKLDREAYINVACKYYWILSVMNGVDYWKKVIEQIVTGLDDFNLDFQVQGIYLALKGEIVDKMVARRETYEQNREAHKEQKTADKQFYRFLQATGYTIDVDPMRLPIRRLIQIYSVYFQDLKKLKRDLDKKGESPYID
jgi:hypothetical protein